MTFKEIRKSAGMTQKAISERWGIPPRTVQNWDEGGNIKPYVKRMIEELLGVKGEQQ